MNDRQLVLFPRTGQSAILSPDRRYRYRLTRVWDCTRPTLCFVGLNPSTADETQDDPTVRRCIGFADRMNYGSVVMVNLFAARTMFPRDLRHMADPIGPGNEKHIVAANRDALTTVAAWGCGGRLQAQDDYVLSLLEGTVMCLGVTQRGDPRHPLYLPNKSPLIPLPRMHA